MIKNKNAIVHTFERLVVGVIWPAEGEEISYKGDHANNHRKYHQVQWSSRVPTRKFQQNPKNWYNSNKPYHSHLGYIQMWRKTRLSKKQ